MIGNTATHTTRTRRRWNQSGTWGKLVAGAAGILLTAGILAGSPATVSAQNMATCPALPAGAMSAGMGSARAAGQITAISGNTVTIQGADGAARTVTADDQTTISKTAAIALTDLKMGDIVTVQGSKTGDATYSAKLVNVFSLLDSSGGMGGFPSGSMFMLPGGGTGGANGMFPAGCNPFGAGAAGNALSVAGTVAGMNGATITLTMLDGTTATVTTDGNTTVAKQGKASVSDLRTGDNALALARPGTDASGSSFTALTIEDRGSLAVDASPTS